MYSIMHISDLHRSQSDPITNAELISCLLADVRRYDAEKPPISKPDAIIVSGDLVQGLPLNSIDYPVKLQEQYDEALELLIMLADTFLNGDRSRLIMVPGNHDVDWNIAVKAMEVSEVTPARIQDMHSNRASNYRWSWKDIKLYHVIDQALYNKRFDYYRNTFNTFYKDVSSIHTLDANRDWNLFSLNAGNIIVCAFNSCAKNDCYRDEGEISKVSLAESHMKVLSVNPNALQVAVWHHNIKGPPHQSDYMDSSIIDVMIDKGYRLGFHGHQHKSDGAPHSLFTSGEQIMTIISAGSLCAGNKELPQGFNRQYNLVEIDQLNNKACLHVREMTHANANVFCAGKLPSLGGVSNTEVYWTPVPTGQLVNAGRSGGDIIALADKIELLIASKEYNEAIAELKNSGFYTTSHGRKLFIDALFKKQDWIVLIEQLKEPQNATEYMYLFECLKSLKQWDRAIEVLEELKSQEYITLGTFHELNQSIKAERKIRNA